MLWIRAIIEEIRLSLKMSWSYRTSFISEIVTLLVVFGGMMFTYYGDTSDAEMKSSFLAEYILFYLTIIAISNVSTNITQELHAGTFEQKIMTKIPIYVLLFGQSLSILIVSSINILVVVLASNVVFGIGIELSVISIFVMFISFIGMYGIGMILGAISLTHKKIGKVSYLLQMGLLFLYTSGYKSSILKAIPLFNGGNLIRKNVFGMEIATSELIILILVSIIWLVIGAFIFKFFERKSKLNGNLGYY